MLNSAWWLAVEGSANHLAAGLQPLGPARRRWMAENGHMCARMLMSQRSSWGGLPLTTRDLRASPDWVVRTTRDLRASLGWVVRIIVRITRDLRAIYLPYDIML